VRFDARASTGDGCLLPIPDPLISDPALHFTGPSVRLEADVRLKPDTTYYMETETAPNPKR